jgi:hypothetical protein
MRKEVKVQFTKTEKTVLRGMMEKGYQVQTVDPKEFLGLSPDELKEDLKGSGFNMRSKILDISWEIPGVYGTPDTVGIAFKKSGNRWVYMDQSCEGDELPQKIGWEDGQSLTIEAIAEALPSIDGG